MFIDEVHDYQSFIKNNFYLLGSQYNIIQEQFHVKNSILDILAYNQLEERLVIIELKNPKAPYKAIAQIVRYYQYLKDSQLDNYIISRVPECLLVAPAFSSKIILPEFPIIRCFQMDYEYAEFKDITHQFKTESVINLDVKLKPSLHISPSTKSLIFKIKKRLLNIYNDQLVIAEQNNQISFLSTQNKKIVAKIIIPYDWFTNYIDLVLYNRFIKPFDRLTFMYDPSIYKYSFNKSMVRLKVIDIPEFLRI